LDNVYKSFIPYSLNVDHSFIIFGTSLHISIQAFYQNKVDYISSQKLLHNLQSWLIFQAFLDRIYKALIPIFFECWSFICNF